MKTVFELSSEELEELRGSYFEQLKEMDIDILGDITTPEELPMDVVMQHYEGTVFVDDDFFCNQH